MVIIGSYYRKCLGHHYHFNIFNETFFGLTLCIQGKANIEFIDRPCLQDVGFRHWIWSCMANEANRQTGSMLHLCPQKEPRLKFKAFNVLVIQSLSVWLILKNFTSWNSMSESNVYNLDASGFFFHKKMRNCSNLIKDLYSAKLNSL